MEPTELDEMLENSKLWIEVMETCIEWLKSIKYLCFSSRFDNLNGVKGTPLLGSGKAKIARVYEEIEKLDNSLWCKEIKVQTPRIALRGLFGQAMNRNIPIPINVNLDKLCVAVTPGRGEALQRLKIGGTGALSWISQAEQYEHLNERLNDMMKDLNKLGNSEERQRQEQKLKILEKRLKKLRE